MVDSWFNWLSSLQYFCPPFLLLDFCNCLPSLSSTLILTDWTVKLPKKWSTTLCRSHLCVCLSSRGLKAEVTLRRCEPHTHRLLPLHLRFTPGTFPCVSSVYFAWGISAGGSQEREREREGYTNRTRASNTEARRWRGDTASPGYLLPVKAQWRLVTSDIRVHACLCALSFGHGFVQMNTSTFMDSVGAAPQIYRRKFTGAVWCYKPWCHTALKKVRPQAWFLQQHLQQDLDSFDRFYCG